MAIRPEFTQDLEALITRYSLENASDTPDYILAAYLQRCLEVWNVTMQEREEWWGRKVPSHPEQAAPLPPPTEEEPPF